ncbi:uncharacterized protein Bfra_004510 [Botrytis fragariae]|uniref:Uncharacterized protein n=1 Tax=Botrytis fragariae TaxID=1964551 RepID=A0A8H6EJT9_9HELO|nr:uncharacterized protein Bfra_004510 [Botrytis fragariae]KAF5874500.1 hypothetical protein Bfra_004510 [Botrytis fragariae]
MATIKFGQATNTIFNVSRNKYGEKRAYVHPHGYASAASGWSPTGYLHPSGSLNKIEEEKRIEEFQRTKLRDFTIRELVDFDIVSGRILEEADLESIPIHPIFSQNMWEKLGQRQREWPLQTPELMEGGHYIMDNPYILKEMKPVLTLASAFLSEMHTLPFLDAMLLGPRKPVNSWKSKIPLPDGLYTFWRRDQEARTANGSEECEKAFTKRLKALHKKIIWGFAHGNRMPWDDAPIKTNCLGITHMGWDSADREVIWIYLDIKICDLLLRNDLTSAEKAGAQYYLAITMIHELTHAIGFDFRDDPNIRLCDGYEPYFENSPQCELGFEMENSVFGGIIEPVFKAPAAPLAYRMASSYPCWCHVSLRNMETMVLELAEEYNNVLYTYFIPIQTYEDLRKLSFWDTVIRRFGFSAIHARSIRYGWGALYLSDWSGQDEYGVPESALMKSSRFTFHEGRQKAKIKELAELVELYQAKQLSPSRKTAFKVLDDIMTSASKEEQFYDFTQKQEDKLSAIREACIELQKPSNAADAGQRGEVALLLIPKLEQAIVAHKEAFVLLETSEALRHGKFRDRRATLFRWNVGTRKLLNDILTGVDEAPNKDENLIATLEQLAQFLVQLEDVRLKIFPPLPTWTIGHEFKPEGIEELKQWPENLFSGELAELDFMYHLYTAALEPNLSRCRALAANRMMKNQGSSSISFYCRFVCMTLAVVCSDDWMEKDWEERNIVVEEKLQWLKTMREGCTVLWGSTFEGWIQWFEGRRMKREDEKAAEEAARTLE